MEECIMAKPSKKKKNPIYELFESNYDIDFFYKPSSENIDVFYYIVLDNTVRLTIKVFENNVLAIHEIIPMTNALLSKFYEELLTFLRNQTKFTVIISRIGYTDAICVTCDKMEFPLVDDARFLTVPGRLYDKMKLKYQHDVNKYGFYIVTVNDSEIESFDTNCDDDNDELTVSDPTISEDIIVEDQPVLDKEPDGLIDKFITYLNTSRFVSNVLPLDKGKASFEWAGINVTFEKNGTIISILEVESPDNVSAVQYMALFQFLEGFLPSSNIIIEMVTNPIVYKVCRARDYKRVMHSINVRLSANTFGTFELSKMK